MMSNYDTTLELPTHFPIEPKRIISRAFVGALLWQCPYKVRRGAACRALFPSGSYIFTDPKCQLGKPDQRRSDGSQNWYRNVSGSIIETCAITKSDSASRTSHPFWKYTQCIRNERIGYIVQASIRSDARRLAIYIRHCLEKPDFIEARKRFDDEIDSLFAHYHLQGSTPLLNFAADSR